MTLAATASSNAATQARIQSAASTNATSVKTSAGQLYGIDIGNNGTTDAWLKLYALASAPTVGTSTPFWTIYAPKSTGRFIALDVALPFSTGLAYAITGGAADSDTTAVAAAQVTGIINYK